VRKVTYKVSKSVPLSLKNQFPTFGGIFKRSPTCLRNSHQRG